jgi:outer membrane protein assembly factor BamB
MAGESEIAELLHATNKVNPMDAQDPVVATRLRELIGRLVFVGFNSRVAALDRLTGEIVWKWKCPRGTSTYVALLLDDDRLMVSVQGFTYCLNPLTGEDLWSNPMEGFGYGIPTIVSVNGNSSASAAAQEVEQEQQQSNAATTTSTNP